MADTVQRGPRDIAIVTFGEARPELLDALRSSLFSTAETSARSDALILVVGALRTTGDAAVEAAQIERTLETLFLETKGFTSRDGSLLSNQNLAFIIDDEAAMGDPSRIADSTLAGAILSFARSLSLELRRVDTSVATFMTATIERNGVEQPDDAVGDRIAAAIDEGIETTGREDFLGRSVELGRIRP
jgi:hypothetical protein